MAVVAMQKVAVIAPRSEREALLSALQDEGVLEVSDARDMGDIEHIEVRVKAAELQYAITVLNDHAPKAVQALAAKKSTQSDIESATSRTDVRGMVDTLREMETEDTNATRKEDELMMELETLKPWKHYPEILHTPPSNAFVDVRFGVMSLAQVEMLKEKIEAEIRRASLRAFKIDDSSQLVEATVWKSDLAQFEQVATTLGWTAIAIPTRDASGSKVVERIQGEIDALRMARLKRTERRVKLSSELPQLVRVRTYMKWLDSKQSVREAAAESPTLITLMGWMPKNRVAVVEARLGQKVNQAVQVFRVKPEEGEEAPVLLKNSSFITPFESVTTLYGLPLSTEADPTRALSPFFVLFFGLCLTDAGYGLVLALLFGAFLLKTRATIEEARLPWLLFISGIVTIIVSIPFGGYFGLTPDQVPLWLTKETPEGRLFIGQIWNLSSQKGIAFLQNLSLVLGLVHIFFGVFLSGYYKWIHGAKAEAFWTAFTAHILLGAVILSFVVKATWMPWVLYGSIALFIWGKGFGSPWYLRPIMGFLGVMNFMIGLLSNGLSYLRLLALGLVTGAIALAVNQVAIEMGALLPVWIGIPFTILIAVAGHTVSIALNTLGSFIHSGRLQFIEFFSQFFEGGGRQFSPFSRSTL
ncbi:MAG: V-type ATPase 116kDa subunit family protein [Candidatus Peribacteraceae bacterium]